MRTTIQDIADKLGVSVATVSRSLRHNRDVNPIMRARVLKASMELGYQGLPRRRRHKTRGRTTLGVMLSSASLDLARKNPVALPLIEGMSAEAEAEKVVLSLHTIKPTDRHHMADPDVLPGPIRDHACDLVILQGRQYEEDVRAILAHAPVVSLNWAYPGLNVDVVGTDGMSAIYQITMQFLQRGHRRLAWVDERVAVPRDDERKLGFIKACADQVLDIRATELTRYWVATGEPADLEMLRAAIHEGVTGFVCVAGGVASAVAEAIHRLGLKIPGDVSISGFDATAVPMPEGRQLVSADPFYVEIGRAAVRMALQRLRQSAFLPMTLRLAPRLTPGDTIGSPPDHSVI